MTFEIELDRRRCAVSVEAASPGRYRVVIDGQARDVLAERIGEFGLAVVPDSRDGSAAGPSREVYVAPAGAPGELLVSVRGRTVPVAVDGRTRRRRAADGGRHADGEQAVSAPMPGRVVRVLVGPGDEVTARQGVVVVEAMKMENELRSPKAGRVRDVTVTPGMSVEAGRVLVVIE